MPSGVAGTLTIRFVAVDRLPEPARLGERRLGVVREVRRDLEADVAVAAAGRVVDRAQHVGGVPGCPRSRAARRASHDATSPALSAALRARRRSRSLPAIAFSKIDGIRGDAAQAVLLDEALELALGDEAAADEVEPDGLILLGVEGLERVHADLSRDRRACGAPRSGGAGPCSRVVANSSMPPERRSLRETRAPGSRSASGRALERKGDTRAGRPPSRWGYAGAVPDRPARMAALPGRFLSACAARSGRGRPGAPSRGEAELLEKVLEGGRGAEGVHAHDGPAEPA